MRSNPLVVVVAGPNGAGKSTLAPRLLRGALTVSEFVNADTIARGLSAFRPESVAFTAGRLLLDRLHVLASVRADFAFETTLASRSYVPWLLRLSRSGYRSHLVYLSLPSDDLAVARVAERVRKGGHDVPVETVRRRYLSGLRNFFALYRAAVASWQVYDNGGDTEPRLLAAGEDEVVQAVDERGWQRLKWLAKVKT